MQQEKHLTRTRDALEELTDRLAAVEREIEATRTAAGPELAARIAAAKRQAREAHAQVDRARDSAKDAWAEVQRDVDATVEGLRHRIEEVLEAL